jgi:hypothetical protein
MEDDDRVFRALAEHLKPLLETGNTLPPVQAS